VWASSGKPAHRANQLNDNTLARRTILGTRRPNTVNVLADLREMNVVMKTIKAMRAFHIVVFI
jgi:hypothetical protein